MTQGKLDIRGSLRTFRSVARQAMTAAAKKKSVKVDAGRASFSSNMGSVCVINAPFKLDPDFTLDHLTQGRDLLFIYLSAPAGAVLVGTSDSLPTGYYIVRFTGTPKSLRAQVRNMRDEIMHECDANVELGEEVEMGGRSTMMMRKSGGSAGAAPAGSSGFSRGRGNIFGCASIDLDGDVSGVKYHIQVKLCY
jgi:hypothetical protein